MKSVTLVFPGQGSQYVGMGKGLLEAATLYDLANDKLGFDLKSLCLNGPIEELTLTQNTQPAIVAHSVAFYNQFKRSFPDVKIDQVLGHSVGEYSALVAAESLTFEDAVKAVNLRGSYMQEAVPAGQGKMIALLKMPQELIEKACLECSSDDEQAAPANFNNHDQVVISGHANACDRVVEWLGENFDGRVRAIPLKVSAPFHCSLMKPAESSLAKHFEKVNFKENATPYIANIDAEVYEKTSGETIKKNLIDQVCGSVRWTQSIEKVKTDLFIEVGPGKVLTGLIKKIRSDIPCIPMDQENSIELIKEALQ